MAHRQCTVKHVYLLPCGLCTGTLGQGVLSHLLIDQPVERQSQFLIENTSMEEAFYRYVVHCDLPQNSFCVDDEQPSEKR